MDRVHQALETAMCHWSSQEYERRLRDDPTRSFFQALRDLFRRPPRRPQVEAPEVGAEVIPLRAEAAGRRVDVPAAERADAA
jgi:hypothetical protein